MCAKHESRKGLISSRCSTSMQPFVLLPPLPRLHPKLTQKSGGLGLTGGIADISALFDCFLGIHQGLTDDSIFDHWSKSRIRKWKEIINPASRANFRRLWDKEAHEEREAFFEQCREISKGGEGRKQFRMVGLISIARGRRMRGLFANFA
jgi:hypothetical protein